jgi:hypothetical protein
MYQSADFDYLLTSHKQLIAFNCFWIGFIIYTLSYTLFSVNFISTFKTTEVLQAFGIFLFIGSSFFLIHIKFSSLYLKVTFFIYVLWLLSVLARGFSFNSQYVSTMLFEDYVGMFPYFAPLVLLLPQKIILYKRLFQVITITALLCLLFYIVFIRQLINRDVTNVDSRNVVENLSRHLAMPSIFLLITYSYQTKKVKYLAWFIVFLTIGFAIIRARRGMLFTLTAPMVFAAFMYFRESKRKMALILISILSIVVIGVYALQFFSQSSFFSSFRSRVDEDTRSGVEDCFYSDMKAKDWIIGKGVNGEYYCPHVDPDSLTDYRLIIETDYLNIILKGGIVSLALLLIITIPAMVKGIFYSNNNFSRAAGFWILLWILNLYPTTVVNFTLNYLLFWIAVGICYNKKIRSIPEEIIKTYFSRLAVVPNQS